MADFADGSPAGIAAFDTRLRYVYVNPALEGFNGIPAAAHLGRTVQEVLPQLNARDHVMQLVLRDGTPRLSTTQGQSWGVSRHEERYWQAAYHRLEQDGVPVGVVVILLEMSEVKSEGRELERARRHLALLATAAVNIGTTLDMDTTCEELARFVVPSLADFAAVEVFPPEVGHSVRQAPPGILRMRRAGFAAAHGYQEGAAAFNNAGEYIDYAEDAVVARCLAANEPVVMDLGDENEFGRSGATDELLAAYRASGLRTALVVPLVVRGVSLGALSLVRSEQSPPFDAEDVLVAGELAHRAATDLDHARRYAREHTIARELQASLLSEPRGAHPHVEVATRYLPADRGAVVGGDWFDVVPLRDGRHLKAMGDVMGHGVEAAVAMSHYRSLLRLLAGEDLPPHRILEQLDRMVQRSGLDRAATCLLAVVDRFAGMCEVASAGHLPPVFIDPGADHSRVVPVKPGPPLGMGFGGYRTETVPCGPGTVLFMYTDGLVERRGEDIDVSVRRLSTLTMPRSGDLEDLLDEAIDRFGEGADDDIAVLASRIREDVGFGRWTGETTTGQTTRTRRHFRPTGPKLVDGPRPATGPRLLGDSGPETGPTPSPP
ncbi:SpoIIE family protein phosphatase [Streptomyces sp. NBC_00102]|uniref:SpoIIE family protein phosphatase n=1 Tax=Streptomyces sp. NBC_00102 TaxID=2975652 RepID=UPI0022582B2B|nr:SpoIIE family protein phosphatase [Streptomyces sp. NBC_00102]MCX5398446.1 SpoIIE family protein phosphatase [Streptomyces sp. NBC_00102]